MNPEKVALETPAGQELTYFVDGEKQETKERELTVAQILEKAGLDPKTHYLVELRGAEQIKLTDLNELVKLHEHEKFISVFTGVTPLS